MCTSASVIYIIKASSLAWLLNQGRGKAGSWGRGPACVLFLLRLYKPPAWRGCSTRAGARQAAGAGVLRVYSQEGGFRHDDGQKRVKGAGTRQLAGAGVLRVPVPV